MGMGKSDAITVLVELTLRSERKDKVLDGIWRMGGSLGRVEEEGLPSTEEQRRQPSRELERRNMPTGRQLHALSRVREDGVCSEQPSPPIPIQWANIKCDHTK